jgi:hypothetical protein
MTMKEKTTAQKEVETAVEQIKAFDENVKNMTMDAMNKAPLLETENQTKLSSSEIANSKDIYLKPQRSIGSREKFNERFREDYRFSTEFVNFIAENKEIIGEDIELWTKPFPGMPAEFWKVPTNKPIWGPRHLAEKIKRSRYHRLKMDQGTITSADGNGTYYGGITVDTTVQRLDAIPVTQRKSLFMGANF